jgi:hypothetical protein
MKAINVVVLNILVSSHRDFFLAETLAKRDYKKSGGRTIER